MSKTKPSMKIPVSMTVVALLDFAATIFMAAEASGETPRLIVMTLAEITLIALALASWISYLRKYIDCAVAGQSGGE